MKHLILHEYTRMQLDTLARNKPHAIVLIGPKGIGKRAIAEAWAGMITSKESRIIIEPDEKGTLSIEAIRMLYQRTRSKQSDWQVVIIDHAEALGVEAQNAFLKLLEEPRDGLTFVLTAPSLDVLLPTIASRTQHILVHKPSQAMLLGMIPATTSAADRAKLLFMADGRPATLYTLLHDNALFTRHSELMQKAKRLLTASQYEQLTAINELAKNKNDLFFVLEALAYMVKLQLAREPTVAQLTFAKGLNDCLARLAQNGNPRAQLTHLFTATYLV